VAELVDAADL